MIVSIHSMVGLVAGYFFCDWLYSLICIYQRIFIKQYSCDSTCMAAARLMLNFGFYGLYHAAVGYFVQSVSGQPLAITVFARGYRTKQVMKCIKCMNKH